MATYPDSRQVKKRSALSVLGTSTNSNLDTITDKINTEFESPLRMYATATPDAKLNFANPQVSNADGSKDSVTPVSNVITAALTTSPAFINFQTQALSNAADFNITFPASTVGYFRHAGFTFFSGKIYVSFSAETSTEGALSNPGSLFVSGGTPLGYITLEATNVAGYFKTAGSATSVIENTKIFRFGSGGGAGGSSVITRTEFTATEGQTTFTVSYTAGFIHVYVNGTRLYPSDFTATNGTSVTLDEGVQAGALVMFEKYDAMTIANALPLSGGTLTGALMSSDTTQSTTKDTGSIITEGGVGIEKNLNVGGDTTTVGTTYAKSGTAAAPGFSFTSDPNTGIYNSADLVGIATNGTARLTVDSTGRIKASDGIKRGLGTTQDTAQTTTYYIESGTYSPAITGVSNITTVSTPGNGFWMRVGNAVTFWGEFTVTGTTGTTLTQVSVTIPIASDFGTNTEGSGTVWRRQTGTNLGSMDMRNANDDMMASWVLAAGDAGASRTFGFHCSYFIV